MAEGVVCRQLLNPYSIWLVQILAGKDLHHYLVSVEPQTRPHLSRGPTRKLVWNDDSSKTLTWTINWRYVCLFLEWICRVRVSNSSWTACQHSGLDNLVLTYSVMQEKSFSVREWYLNAGGSLLVSCKAFFTLAQLCR